MLLQPLYEPADLRTAYQLRYGWTGWPSKTLFPVDVVASVFPTSLQNGNATASVFLNQL
jgi:hypothetical protein